MLQTYVIIFTVIRFKVQSFTSKATIKLALVVKKYGKMQPVIGSKYARIGIKHKNILLKCSFLLCSFKFTVRCMLNKCRICFSAFQVLPAALYSSVLHIDLE